MEWDNIKDRAALLAFKEAIDCDEIKVKEQVKKILLNNRFIIHVLNNKELEDAEAEPDEYFGINILPYYMVQPVQSNVQNYLCFEVQYDEAASYRYSKSHQSLNSTVKTLQLVFHILCEQKNIIDEDTNLPRHDLLAGLIIDQFNWSNYFGPKIMLVSDVPNTVDGKYASRTLVFEQTTDNNIVQTIDGVPRLINKVRYE